MTKDEDFKLLKLQTCELRVNIHCDGCKQKVKKSLQRIEGVYQVKLDAEQQKVTVSGSVDTATLIKKLTRAGKHAELWSQKPKQNQNQKANNGVKDAKNNKAQKQNVMKGPESLQSQQNFPFLCEEDDDFLDDLGEFDEEEQQLIRERLANQLAMLRQQAMPGNNNQKNNVKVVNNNLQNPQNGNNAGRKGNQNQNMGVKTNPNPGAIDPRAMAALKMNNVQLGGGNVNPVEAKGPNDITAMMNLAGFHGNAANNNIAAVLGGNPNVLGGNHQFHHNNGFQGPSSSSGGIHNNALASGYHHPPSSSMRMNMNGGYQQQQLNHPSVMMNLQNRNGMQQPQMMYNRSPFIPPTTGYYYSYGPSSPYSYYYESSTPSYSNGGDSSAATHMFSDDNTSSCSIM